MGLFDWFNSSKTIDPLPMNPEVEEQDNEVEEVEEEPKEYIDIHAEGRYTVEVVKREERYHWQAPYYIEFKYEAKVKFLDREIDSDGVFNIDANEEYTNRSLMVSYTGNYEEYTYLFLANMLESEEGQERIMGNIKNSIVYDINRYVKDKNIEEIKKVIEEKSELGFNFTFQTEKSKRLKNM